MLEATVDEKAYINKVLDCFMVRVPDATRAERARVAANTLFRMRLWEVIYQFRVNNYRVQTVLDAEVIG